ARSPRPPSPSSWCPCFSFWPASCSRIARPPCRPSKTACRAKELNMRKHGFMPAAAISIVVASCTMAPRYPRPAPPVPGAWHAADYRPGQSREKTAADLPWREFVQDEKLQKVIEQALTNNRDLRSALASIESARAQYRIQRSDLLPKINGEISASKQKS